MGLHNIQPPDPSLAPEREPGDFVDGPAGYASPLAKVAAEARPFPGKWYFVDYMRGDKQSYDYQHWVNSVRRGEKGSLGARSEQWDAEVKLLTLADGTKVGAKYIAYIGPRDVAPPPPLPVIEEP